MPGWLGRVVGRVEFRGWECRVVREREEVRREVAGLAARDRGIGTRLVGLRGLLRARVEDVCVWERDGKEGCFEGEWWWRDAPEELGLWLR